MRRSKAEHIDNHIARRCYVTKRRERGRRREEKKTREIKRRVIGSKEYNKGRKASLKKMKKEGKMTRRRKRGMI